MQIILMNLFNETKSVVNIYETVNKEMFEKIINNKSPTIFTNINTKNTSNGNIKDKIQHIFQPYIIPYATTHNYDIQNENTDSYSPLIKQTNYRHLLLLLSGKKNNTDLVHHKYQNYIPKAY